MAYSELPKLKKNSVSTTLSSGINDTDTTIPATELSVFYDADSNLITKGIVIGYDNATDTYAEEITITGASGTSGAGNLTGATRGVNADGTIGAAKAHIATTNIAVMFSTGIYENIRDNQIAIEANTRQILTANTTYYVATTGNDSTGDGTSGNPWATIQHAYDYIVMNIDTAGYTTTIQVADGTYTAGLSITKSWVGGGEIQLIGNETTTDNCVYDGTGIFLQTTSQLPAPLTISGFKTITTSTRHINITKSGYIKIGTMNFGSATVYCIVLSSNGAHININFSDITISGTSYIAFASVSSGGTVTMQYVDMTLSDTPNFSSAFIVGTTTSKIIADHMAITGSATGSYYTISLNSVLSLAGGSLPGDTAGTTATGGQVS